MRAPTLSVILFSAILGWSCKDSGTNPIPPAPVPAGAFAYTSFNEAGRVDETGWLLLNANDPDHVVGTWQLSMRGSGELRGRIENGRIIVDFHPDYIDDNYVLDGVIQRGKYTGSWTQIGIAGIMASGRFEARQQ
jgi:hypothetical protein